MSSPASPSKPWFSTLLWGNSIALSWTWGLGLFFSVQFTLQFGVFGLLTFAIPNALGLVGFGLVTHHLARREKGSESLARFFTSWSRPFRLIFFLYQVLAITLTIFAFVRYGWQTLGFEPWQLYLPLTLLIVLAAAILFGEEFDIKRIKYSHGVLALLGLVAVVLIIVTTSQKGPGPLPTPGVPKTDLNYWSFAIPIIVGFLTGPWLDLQQWQRAIQMHRERVSIAAAYWIGALEFFGIMIFHGLLALWALSYVVDPFREGLAHYQYGHEIILKLFYQNAALAPWTFAAYCTFLCVAILTTLDSGYIAFRWFFEENLARSNNAIFALLPKSLLTSPIPVFALCGVIALVAAILKLELEYFMIFFGTFFVGYSTLGIVRAYMIRPANAIPSVKMFCIGSLAVIIFSYGYFLRYPLFMIAGSLLPLASIAWLLFKPGSQDEFVSDVRELESQAPAYESHGPAPGSGGEAAGAVQAHEIKAKAEAIAREAGILPTVEDGAPVPSSGGGHDIFGHFEGKWFVHSFISTYADTNSVGNVYFGMYAMWVGKTRELFFNKVLPKFDLKDTPFYILTRSFEHKFVRETREFERVSVRLRISGYNRKFVTLEHEIYDSSQHLLGKGKQSLLFVSSADYRMTDLPAEIVAAFIAYT
jgi:acyl-CoA thioesterase FadM